MGVASTLERLGIQGRSVCFYIYVVVEGGFCQIIARISNKLREQITRRLVEDTLVDLKD